MMAQFTRKRAPFPPVRLTILPLLLAMATGCASNPPVRAGLAGPPLPIGTAIALIGVPADEAPSVAQARQAVMAVLVRRGHPISADGATRLDIGLTDRPAATGIAIIGGETLSPAKRRRLLQSCDLRTYRLVLTHYGAGSALPITRAWAETHQCKGKLDGSIAQLARQAVTALAEGTGQIVPAATATAAVAAPLTPLQPPPAAP